MTAATHRRFSVCFALIGAMFIEFSSVNYYLSLIILLAFSRTGGLFPDVDHQWSKVKEKTVFNWIVNKFIHLTKGHHRSWQTHSWDIVIVFVAISFMLPTWLLNEGIINAIDKEILTLVLCGFSLGWLSHLFSDMLNHVGVRIVCWSNKKVKFVPKQLFGMKFTTGDDWEIFVNKFQKYLNFVIGIMVLIYPYKDIIKKLITV